MNKITFVNNPLDPDDYEIVECENIMDELTTRYTTFPKTARIYHDQVSMQTDVTPVDKQGVKRLQELAGQFYVVQYPEWAAVPYIVAFVAAVVAAVALRNTPKINVDEKQENNNNNTTKLASRSNKSRYGERIADIYGTVKVYPDLLANSLDFNEVSTKYEISKMCVGLGNYHVYNFKEGEELIEGKEGECVYVERLQGGRVVERTVYNETNIYNMINIRGLLDVYSTPLKVGNKDVIPLYRPFRLEAHTYPYFEMIGGRLTMLIRTIEKNENIQISQYYKSGDVITITSQVSQGGKFIQHIENMTIHASGDTLYCEGTFPTMEEARSFVNWFHDNVEGIFIPSYTYYNRVEYKTYGAATTVSVNGKPDVIYTNPRAIYTTNVRLKFTGVTRLNYVTHQSQTTTPSIPLHKIPGLQIQVKPNDSLVVGDFVITTVEEYRVWLDGKQRSQVVLPRGFLSGAGATSSVSVSANTIASYKKEYTFETRDDIRRLMVSINAPQGLYTVNKDDGKQRSLSAVYGIRIYDITEGESLYHEEHKTLRGEDKTKRALSLQFELVRTMPNNRRFRVDLFCVTGYQDGDNVVQDVYVESIQLLRDINYATMPDCVLVTTITRTGVDNSLTNQRSFNLIASRKLDYEMYLGNLPQNAFPISILDIITNPLIGGMPVKNVDIESLLKTFNDIEQYFGHNGYAWFNFAFKDDNLSMEEMLLTVSNVCPVKIKRIGSKFFFEADLPMVAPKLLFNHRNMLPDTTKKTYNFGINNDYDGVEFKFADKEQDYIDRTIQIPNSGLTKPKKITLNGCTHEGHARMLAWREWNGLRFRSKTIQFDALQEANVLTSGDFIIVPDELVINNHVVSAGEVLAVSGLKLTLSQPCNLQGSETETYIIIQHSDGSIESVPCIVNDKTSNVWLNKPPRVGLNCEGMVKPLYWVTTNDFKDFSYYQVDEREPLDAYSSKITAQEYNPKIYEMDKQ